MKNLSLPLLVFLLPALAHAEVYKWKDEDGKIHYSDTPPAASSTYKKDSVKIRKEDEIKDCYVEKCTGAERAEALRSRLRLRRAQRVVDTEAGVYDGKIVVGMTPGQVLRSWGGPGDKTRTIGAGANNTQVSIEGWIYKERKMVVYFTDRRVTEVGPYTK